MGAQASHLHSSIPYSHSYLLQDHGGNMSAFMRRQMGGMSTMSSAGYGTTMMSSPQYMQQAPVQTMVAPQYMQQASVQTMAAPQYIQQAQSFAPTSMMRGASFGRTNMIRGASFGTNMIRGASFGTGIARAW